MLPDQCPGQSGLQAWNADSDNQLFATACYKAGMSIDDSEEMEEEAPKATGAHPKVSYEDVEDAEPKG